MDAYSNGNFKSELLRKKLANISLNHQDKIHLGLYLNNTYNPILTKCHLSTIFIIFFVNKTKDFKL